MIFYLRLLEVAPTVINVHSISGEHNIVNPSFELFPLVLSSDPAGAVELRAFKVNIFNLTLGGTNVPFFHPGSHT